MIPAIKLYPNKPLFLQNGRLNAMNPKAIDANSPLKPIKINGVHPRLSASWTATKEIPHKREDVSKAILPVFVFDFRGIIVLIILEKTPLLKCSGLNIILKRLLVLDNWNKGF